MRNKKELNVVFCCFCGKKYSEMSINNFSKNKKLITCDNCGQIVYNNPKPVVIALIKNEEGKILLAKRVASPFRNYWGLPGGFLNYGENPTDAIKRELKEELGVSARIHNVATVYDELYDTGKGRVISLTVIVFNAALPRNVKITPRDDVSEAMFFEVNKMPPKIAFNNLKKILSKLIRHVE